MKITVNEFLSLDGVMQGPGGQTEDESGGFERGGWMVPHCVDEDFGAIVTGWFATCDAMLLGRTTYNLMYAHWPNVTDDDPVTTALNHGPKYVVSDTLTDDEAGWENSTVVRGGVDAVARLKADGEGELQVHGSWQLAHSLHNAGLVDEYRLLIFPTVVGDGKRLFDHASTPSGFTVVDRHTTSSGATALRLVPTEFRTGTVVIEDGHNNVVA